MSTAVTELAVAVPTEPNSSKTVDIPADVGEAAGSNPNIFDFDGEEYLIRESVCEIP